MAKKADGQIELKDQQSADLANIPDNIIGGALLEGSDEPLQLSRATMYSGTTEEQLKYKGCGFEPGDFIDVMGKRKLASSKMVVVRGYKTWECWPDGSKSPVYAYRSKGEVPPEDLEWIDRGKGKNEPLATECINAVALFDGEAWPYLFKFKKTSLKVGVDIFTLEARRSTTGGVRGCYELGSKDATSSQGKAFIQMTYRPVGDCPASLHGLLSKCIEQIQSVMAKAAEQHDDAADDNIPI